MEYSTKTRNELLALCKEKNIKGYSGKKKDEMLQLLMNTIPKEAVPENAIPQSTIADTVPKYIPFPSSICFAALEDFIKH
jgi:hypothetical protein